MLQYRNRYHPCSLDDCVILFGCTDVTVIWDYGNESYGLRMCYSVDYDSERLLKSRSFCTVNLSEHLHGG